MPDDGGVDVFVEDACPAGGDGLGVAGVGLVCVDVVAGVLVALEEVGLAVGPHDRGVDVVVEDACQPVVMGWG